MLLALAAITASPQAAPAQPVAPERQARAAVRIVRATELRFAEIEQQQPGMLRDSEVRAADGSLSQARLVEFE